MLQSFVSQSCSGFQSPSWFMAVAPISPPQTFWSRLESVLITVSPLTSHEVPEKPDLTCFPAALLQCICVWDRGHQAPISGLLHLGCECGDSQRKESALNYGIKHRLTLEFWCAMREVIHFLNCQWRPTQCWTCVQVRFSWLHLILIRGDIHLH